MKIHLDTDLGSDTDDACALAMLLGWPGVDLVGITTTIDPGGRRAGYVSHCLSLAGRSDIPVAAGAEVSLTTQQCPGGIPDDERYWPAPVRPRPAPPGAALDLLDHSINEGATIVAIGPYTNLALLELARPAKLARVPVVIMGGSIGPPEDGLPSWGPAMDWNVQCDTQAARILAARTQLTMVPVEVTLKAHLRAAHLPRLNAAGPLGQLLARQGKAHAEDNKMGVLAQAHRGLPDDLLNFQYDAVACAVALDWSGATLGDVRLRPVLDGEVLRFDLDERGRPVRVLVDFDAATFTETWLTAVEAAGRPSSS
jgi:purine nucleosidase